MHNCLLNQQHFINLILTLFILCGVTLNSRFFPLPLLNASVKLAQQRWCHWERSKHGSRSVAEKNLITEICLLPGQWPGGTAASYYKRNFKRCDDYLSVCLCVCVPHTR